MKKILLLFFCTSLLSGCSDMWKGEKQNGVGNILLSESQSDEEKLKEVRKLLEESAGSGEISTPNSKNSLSQQELDLLESVPDDEIDQLIDSLFQNIK